MVFYSVRFFISAYRKMGKLKEYKEEKEKPPLRVC